jgi:hypothetical protein
MSRKDDAKWTFSTEVADFNAFSALRRKNDGTPVRKDVWLAA